MKAGNNVIALPISYFVAANGWKDLHTGLRWSGGSLSLQVCQHCS